MPLAQSQRSPVAAPTQLMKAAVLVAPGEVAIQHVAVPLPEGRQVRVRLEGCGVCASNLPPWEGREWFKYPMSPGELGHEGYGVIDEVGPLVTSLKPGDRVGFLANHSYAEFDLAEEDAVVPLPSSCASNPFPAEPLGCALNIFARSRVEPGHTVAIVGIGFLGALLTELATAAGARVLAIARRPFAQKVASGYGASEVIGMDDHWKVIERVKELTGRRFCDVVIEATGKQWPLDLAGELTCERGRLVVAGYHQDGPRQVNMQLWNWRGIDVINAHERDPQRYLDGMRAAADAVAAGSLTPQALYTHLLPLEKLGDALRLTSERPDGFMKAIVTL